jgi:hypothetical protein
LQGAVRETLEEAGARIRAEDCELYTLFNLPYINQVYFFFLTTLRTPDFHAGTESLEVALFAEDEIPTYACSTCSTRQSASCRRFWSAIRSRLRARHNLKKNALIFDA